MPDIYDLHHKAFSRVSAYVITHNGEHVATIAFKFPSDGAGRLYAYVQWIGVPMVRGFDGGCGYDKSTAACASAVRKSAIVENVNAQVSARKAALLTAAAPADAEWLAQTQSFVDALSADRGPTWRTALERAGFTVWQAV